MNELSTQERGKKRNRKILQPDRPGTLEVGSVGVAVGVSEVVGACVGATAGG